MVIELKNYRKSAAARPAVHYGKGVVLSLVLPSLPTTQAQSPALPEDTVAVDQEFMDQVYALASQI